MYLARLILLMLMVRALGAADIATVTGSASAPPLNSVPGVPMTIVVDQGAGAVVYVLNPDGAMVLGPKQCVVPDGNVTIAKPVVDSAEVQMVNPAYEKITYPPNLVRIHKVPFDGTRLVIKYEKEMGTFDKFGYMPHERIMTQRHHFLQVDDAGKEVEAFWDTSMPADPEKEPEKKPEHILSSLTAPDGKAYPGNVTVDHQWSNGLIAGPITAGSGPKLLISTDHGVVTEPVTPQKVAAPAPCPWIGETVVMLLLFACGVLVGYIRRHSK